MRQMKIIKFGINELQFDLCFDHWIVGVWWCRAQMARSISFHVGPLMVTLAFGYRYRGIAPPWGIKDPRGVVGKETKR